MINQRQPGGAAARLQAVRDWTDRIARPQLPDVEAGRPQRRSATSSCTCGTGPVQGLSTREISTDKRKPTVTRTASYTGHRGEHGSLPGARSGGPTRPPREVLVRVQTRPRRSRSADAGRRLGGPAIWDSQTSMHNPMLTKRASGSPRGVRARRRIRDFARRPPRHRRTEAVPVEQIQTASLDVRAEDREDHADQDCFPTQTHLVFAEDANNTLWTSRAAPQRQSSAGSTERCRGTGDEQKSRGGTPLVLGTPTRHIGKRDDYVEPDTRSIRQGQRAWRLLRRPLNPGLTGTRLGLRSWLPGIRHSPQSGTESPVDPLAEVYEPPCTSFGPPRHGHRSQRVVWTPLSSGHLAELRPAEVQGPSTGPRDRPALPGGLDASSLPDPSS